MRKHLASLDGLRGVAALAVVGKHFENLSHIDLHLQQAAVAVDLFFVLSGFVLAQAYEDRLTAGLSWRSYMLGRLGRLYPAILGGLVIAVALRLIFGGSFVWELGFQFLLLPVLFGPRLQGGNVFPLDGPQWSLFWEMVVNGLHAAIFRWLTPARIIALMIVAAAGLCVACAQFGWLDVGWTRRTFWCGLPRVIYGFFAGVLIFRARQRGWKIPKVPYALILAALVLCMIRWIPDWRWFWAGDLSLVVVILPCLVALAVNADASKRWVAPFTWLGAISYPLYTLHVPLLSGFRALLIVSPPLEPWARDMAWWLALAAVIGFAALFEKVYDAPIRAFLAGRRNSSKTDVRDAAKLASAGGQTGASRTAP